jgi:hypothetical protein
MAARTVSAKLPIPVFLTNTSGAAANPAYAEDSAHVTGDAGVLVLGVRNDSGSSMADTNGDYVGLSLNASGEVKVDGLGATNSSASTVGGAGTVNAKLRLVTSQLDAIDKCNATIISQTTAVTIGAGGASDTRLMAVTINAALTGTCVIAGFADGAAAAQSYTIPASAVGSFSFYGALNSAGALTVTCSNAADDNKVIVFWRTA